MPSLSLSIGLRQAVTAARIPTPPSTGLVASYLAGPTWCFTDTAGTIAAGVGDTIACWKDRSGAARHMLQSTAANRPTLRMVSGKYAVQFDAANDSLQWSGAAVSGVAAATIGAAVRNIDGVTSGVRNGLRMRDSGAGSVLVILWSDDKARAVPSDNVNVAMQAVTAGVGDRVVVGTSSGSLTVCRQDGTAATQASTQPTRAVDLVDVAFDGPLGGYVYGFAAYSAALTGADLTALEAFLTAIHP